MTEYLLHTIDTAPEGAREPLHELRKRVGMIPNLAATMSESPQLLRGFLSLREIFYGGTFTPAEVQVLALTNAFENRCSYCMALHTAFALQAGVPDASVRALRAGEAPTEPRLRALSEFSRALVRQRGHASPEQLGGFHAAGYSKAQALEVVLGIAVSILPNYAHHLTGCPVDDAFAEHRWSPEHP